MSDVESGAVAVVPRRHLAGIAVPDTALVALALELAKKHYEPYQYNHVLRSWLFAVHLAERHAVRYDAEVLAVATLLHDIGLVPAFEGTARYEVDGANAARDMLTRAGLDARRAQLLWDAIALHATPSLAQHKEPEVALAAGGIGLDFTGFGYDKVPADLMGEVLAMFPRLGMKKGFADRFCALVMAKPQTANGNFLRDFGERFVPGYKAASSVDYLFDAPFEE